MDASVVVKWLIAEEFSLQAVALMAASRPRFHIVAPPLIISEVTSALHHRVRSGSIDVPGAVRRVAEFLTYDIQIDARTDVPSRALMLASELNQKYPYDALYLALAEILDCNLWTADAAFYRVAVPRYPRVRLLSDYPIT